MVICAKRELRERQTESKEVGAISCGWSEKSSLVGNNICVGSLKSNEELSHAGRREIRLKTERRACAKALRWEFLRRTRG